jgi:hypothetical protein
MPIDRRRNRSLLLSIPILHNMLTLTITKINIVDSESPTRPTTRIEAAKRKNKLTKTSTD